MNRQTFYGMFKRRKSKVTSVEDPASRPESSSSEKDDRNSSSKRNSVWSVLNELQGRKRIQTHRFSDQSLENFANELLQRNQTENDKQTTSSKRSESLSLSTLQERETQNQRKQNDKPKVEKVNRQKKRKSSSSAEKRNDSEPDDSEIFASQKRTRVNVSRSQDKNVSQGVDINGGKQTVDKHGHSKVRGVDSRSESITSENEETERGAQGENKRLPLQNSGIIETSIELVNNVPGTSKNSLQSVRKNGGGLRSAKVKRISSRAKKNSKPKRRKYRAALPQIPNNNRYIEAPDYADDEISRADTPVGHLECYLEIMCYLGVSSYRRDEYANLSCYGEIILRIAFWIFSLIAFTQAVFQLKKGIYYAARLGNLISCVKVGFTLVRCFNRGFFVYLISFCVEKISIMLLHIRKTFQFNDKNAIRNKFSITAVVFGATTIILTLLTVVFSYSDFSEWSLKDALLSRSYDLSKGLFYWSVSNYENVTDNLFEEYYLDGYTSKSVFMATAHAQLDLCGILQGEVIRDLLILAPFVLLTGWKIFESRIASHILIHPNNVDSAELEACIRHYKALRLATASINTTLGAVLKFVLIQNLLLYGYLFVQIITREEMDMRIVHTSIDVLKASATFYISLQIHWMNDNVKQWLRLLTMYKGDVEVEKILGMTIEAALDDLRDNPIGFGTDYFLIKEEFLVTFVTMVASLVAFMVESANN